MPPFHFNGSGIHIPKNDSHAVHFNSRHEILEKLARSSSDKFNRKASQGTTTSATSLLAAYT